MNGDGFTTQFAVRLPNGELMSYQPPHTHASYIFGAEPPPRRPYIYDDRAEAEAACERARKIAAELGVTWNGHVEQRTCGPFTLTDPGAGLGDEIEKWAETQGGQQA